MQTMQTLSHAEAQRAVAAIVAELQRIGKTAVIAVADAHGEVIALLRLDGAPLPCVANATNKAWTAARERKSSWEVGRASRDPKSGFDLANFGDRRYIGWGGGVPVTVAGMVVGAVAVSGLSEQEDEDLARRGATAALQP